MGDFNAAGFAFQSKTDHVVHGRMNYKDPSSMRSYLNSNSPATRT